MSHLPPELLVDIAEGSVPESSQPHLATCPVCRAQLTDLRETLASIAVDVPEPSPLFWDHLSARVREATAAEETTATPGWRFGQLSWRLAAGMSVAIVVMAVALTLRTSPQQAEVASETAAPVVASVVASVVANVVANTDGSVSIGEDPSLSLLGDLADGLDWDSVVEAGMTVPVGAADEAASGLSDAERVELQRLLREAIGSSSASL